VIQELADARVASETALVSLETAMGVDLSSTPTLSDRLDGRSPDAPLRGEIESAEKLRPELEEADHLIAAQEQALRQAKAAYQPQLYAMGMQDVQSASEMGTRGGATVGVVASVPLLDGGGRRSGVRQQEAELRRLGASRQAARLAVREEVSTAWLRLRTARQNVRTSEAAVAQAQEDYRIVSLRHESGKAILVERLDALTALVRAQANHVNARYDLAVARAELDRAVGRSR
jgi:outer membrane protein TolC